MGVENEMVAAVNAWRMEEDESLYNCEIRIKTDVSRFLELLEVD